MYNNDANRNINCQQFSAADTMLGTVPGVYLDISCSPQERRCLGSSNLQGRMPDLGSWPWPPPSLCFVFAVGLTPEILVPVQILHLVDVPTNANAHRVHLLNSSVTDSGCLLWFQVPVAGLSMQIGGDEKAMGGRLVVFVAQIPHAAPRPLAKDTSLWHGPLLLIALLTLQ